MIQILIAGFKSFNKEQSIDIGKKITFLVGPNSSGKSSIAKAIQLLNGESPEFSFDEHLLYQNPNSNEESSFHYLGVKWSDSDENLYSYLSGYADMEGYEGLHEDVLINSTFLIYRLNNAQLMAEKGDNVLNPSSMAIEYDGRRSEMMRFYGEKKTQKKKNNVYLRHSSYANDHIISIKDAYGDARIKEKLQETGEWLAGLLKEMQNNETCKDEWVELLNNWRDLTLIGLENGELEWNSANLHFFISNIFQKQDKQFYLNSLQKYENIISKYKNKIHDNFSKKYPGKNFNLALVSGDRSLPLDEDKKAQFYLSDRDIPNIYHELMQSAVVAEIENDKASLSLSRILADEVNRALTEHLFLETGYQIETRAHLMLRPRHFDEFKEKLRSFPYSCTMLLKDSHGRFLDFDEVGSGIGYVLPVLIECFRPANKNQIVFLQQPELHLHPALQARLTDVLIEAAADRRIIAETHSEHLILRALRRVRQTTNGTLKDPALALRADDVVVNYFEPLPSGETRVHVMRVSEDGDFIDPWPNGFFAERDQELFDE